MILGLTKRELLYTFAAMFFMFYANYVVTIVHELGHALAIIATGGEIIQFVATPFNGGHVLGQFTFMNDYDYGNLCALVMISGGIASSFLFVLIGFFKRPFLACVPVLALQGYAEAFMNEQLIYLCMDLFSLFTVIICLSILYDKLWANN